jgi:hypothetical protein
VRVDPDVFTDALVLPPAWLGPGVAVFLINCVRIVARSRCDLDGGFAARVTLIHGMSDRSRFDDGYRFAKCEGKPNSLHASKPPSNKDFCDSVTVPRVAGSDSIHCDA